MKTKTYVLVLVGALHVEASIGGSLAIPWAQVTALQTDGNVAVAHKGEAPVNGTLAVADGEAIGGISEKFPIQARDHLLSCRR